MMATNCPKCNTYIEFLTFYPHLEENFFKPGISISDIPSDVFENIPKSHLHSYYKCLNCGYKKAEDNEILLLDNEEVDKLIKEGYTIYEKRTVTYWHNWLKNKEK